MPALAYQHTRIFAASAPGAGVDLHSTLMSGGTRITPRLAVSSLRVTVSLAAGSTLSVTAKNGGTTKTFALNGGNALAAGALYSFTIPVSALGKASAGVDPVDLTWDLACGSNVAVDYLDIREIAEEVAT